MKEALLKLIEAERKSNEIDAAWEADPENEELEKAFDEAYTNEWAAKADLITAISKAACMDRNVAQIMVNTKRAELESLILRMA